MDMLDQEILDDIERRNDIRREAFLPLLEVEKEFRRIKELKEESERARKFEGFSEPLKQRVREKVLARMRREKNDPNWNPTGYFLVEACYFQPWLMRGFTSCMNV